MHFPLVIRCIVTLLLSVVSCNPTRPPLNDWRHALGETLEANPFPGTAALDMQLISHGERIMRSVNQTYSANTRSRLQGHNGSRNEGGNEVCDADNIRVRREWSTLSLSDREAFISACHCLHALPSQTSPDLAPGARWRWDDFIVAHILNTGNIHFSGLLLPWHRHFVWLLESALREECGYQGTMPYFDWSKFAFEPLDENPVVSGKEGSLGGNGKAVEHRRNLLVPGGNPPVSVWVPPGSGGGCVSEDGPFGFGGGKTAESDGGNSSTGGKRHWPINLGPVTKLNDSAAGPPNPREDGLGYNPRCLQRDFGVDLLRENSNYWNVSQLIVNHTTIHSFHKRLESPGRGLHGAGHTFIGGLNNDLFASPGDPLFFLHHAMVDRVWSMWQALDFDERVDGLDGSMTSFNYPASDKVTVRDHLYYSPVFANIPVPEVMDTVGGKYCYMYE